MAINILPFRPESFIYFGHMSALYTDSADLSLEAWCHPIPHSPYNTRDSTLKTPEAIFQSRPQPAS